MYSGRLDEPHVCVHYQLLHADFELNFMWAAKIAWIIYVFSDMRNGVLYKRDDFYYPHGQMIMKGPET
jgi:hypothetical protein